MNNHEDLMLHQQRQILDDLSKRYAYEKKNGFIHVYDTQNENKLVHKCKSKVGLLNWQMSLVEDMGLI